MRAAAVRSVATLEGPHGSGPDPPVRITVAAGEACLPSDRVLDLRCDAVSGAADVLTADAVHAAARRLRQPYIDYIGALGAASADPRWWTCSVAERNPFVSQAFHLLSVTAAALALIERGGHRHVVADEPSIARAIAGTLRLRGDAVDISGPSWRSRIVDAAAGVVRFVGHRLYFVAKWTSRILQARFARARGAPALAALAASGDPITVVQTWVDRRCFDAATGTLTDFANVAGIRQALIERGHRVATLPLILRSVPFGAAMRAALARPEPTLLPEAHVTIGDVLRVVIASCRRLPRREYPPFEGIAAQPLLERDDRREHAHHRILDNQLLDRMVVRWRRAGLRVARVVHSFEAHTWERVLATALRREYPGVRIVGILSPALSRFRMNEFLTAEEWQRAPLPDRVITYGPLATSELCAAGCPVDRVVTGAAPWLRRLTSEPAADAIAPQHRAVLVAFGIDRIESRELLAGVRAALGDVPDVLVWLKCHPTLPTEWIGGAALPPHFLVIDRSIADALREAPVAVYGSTGVALDALASGALPVHLRVRSCVDQDPLEFWPDLHAIATDPAALKTMTIEALNVTPERRAERAKAGRRALREYFGVDTGDLYKVVLE